MDFMEREPMSKTLGGSSEPASGLTLREDISVRDLAMIRVKIGTIRARPGFPRIGSLFQIDESTCIDARSLTLKMIEWDGALWRWQYQ